MMGKKAPEQDKQRRNGTLFVIGAVIIAIAIIAAILAGMRRQSVSLECPICPNPEALVKILDRAWALTWQAGNPPAPTMQDSDGACWRVEALDVEGLQAWRCAVGGNVQWRWRGE